MFARFVFGLAAAFLAWVIVGSFVVSLPEWCAHPERPGNAIFQGTSLCAAP